MLSELSELSYNNLRFGPETRMTSARVTQVADTAGRTTTHFVWAR